MKDFTKIFKELREGLGLSQTELARELGVNKSNVNCWESGIRKPDSENLYKLAKYFDVTMEYLLGY